MSSCLEAVSDIQCSLPAQFYSVHTLCCLTVTVYGTEDAVSACGQKCCTLKHQVLFLLFM
jgi:hypothetical protein